MESEREGVEEVGRRPPPKTVGGREGVRKGEGRQREGMEGEDHGGRRQGVESWRVGDG